MNLFDEYNAAVKRADIRDDPLQRSIIADLQKIADEIEAHIPWYNFSKKRSVKGIYMCGPVGIGKTYLMDLFYQSLPENKKSRFHFHYFMQQVDHQLRLLQGKSDPLRLIAANLAKTTRLLCLDEFLVNDVAYAMVLAELLTEIFAHNIVLVVTSNTRPDDLYLDGVGRDRFIPAIELIKKHCAIVQLDSGRDYRIGRINLLEAYVYPLNQSSENKLLEQFKSISKDDVSTGPITVQGRTIQVVKSNQRAVWFEFDVICNLPRCSLDYLEIADRFDVVFVSNIPILTENNTTEVILLMHLIDVLYDRGVRLVVSASVPVKELYQTQNPMKSFERTISRLLEMQSEDYLIRHKQNTVQSRISSN